jgi:hypothetical protein
MLALTAVIVVDSLRRWYAIHRGPAPAAEAYPAEAPPAA